MSEFTRRNVLFRSSQIGLLAGLTPVADAAAAVGGVDDRTETEKLDRECVVGVGMTEEEADCWEATGRLAGKLLALPELHPMERQEISSVIHVIQYRLLSRPNYRKYKDLHKPKD
jgi:hypothetical protein